MHSENVSNWVEGFEADVVLEFVEPQAATATAQPSVASAMSRSRLSPPSSLSAIVCNGRRIDHEVYATADNNEVTLLPR
jgi:hypothetical protein